MHVLWCIMVSIIYLFIYLFIIYLFIYTQTYVYPIVSLFAAQGPIHGDPSLSPVTAIGGT